MQNSWYFFDDSKLTAQQKNVIKLIENTFWVRTADGIPKPYTMTPYQREFHSLNIMAVPQDEFRDRIVIKSRGIGASVSTMIDFLLYITLGFEATIFPIASYSAPASNDLLKKATQIIADTEEQNNIDLNCVCTATSILCKSTGSEIRAIPGGNANAFRRFRAPAIFIDEFAFVMRSDELFSSAQPVLSEGGQMTITSTVISNNDNFMNIVAQYRKGNTGKVFELPLYNNAEFDINKSLVEQKSTPIASWFDLDFLERERLRNPEKFMREFQCVPIDEGMKFYPLPLIMSCVSTEIHASGPYKVCGIDIASINDWAAIMEFTFENDKWYNTFVDVQKMPLPKLQDYIEKLAISRNWSEIKSDCTGPGLQIGQYLKEKFPAKAHPINFATRIEHQKVRNFMAINLKSRMHEGKIILQNNEMLISHLNSWNANLSQSSDKTGHGDLAVATELAMLDVKKLKTEDVKPVNAFIGGFTRKRLSGDLLKQKGLPS